MLLPVTDPPALQQRLSDFRKAHRGYATNCLLSQEQWERAAAQGRLLWQETEGCLSLVLLHRRAQQQVGMFYCFAASLKDIQIPRVPYLLYTEVIEREKKQAQWQEALHASGMQVQRTYRQMQADAQMLREAAKQCRDEANPPQVVSLEEPCHAFLVAHLYDDFDPVFDQTPSPQDMEAFMLGKTLLCARSAQTQQPLGYLLYSMEGPTTVLHYIAVFPPFRKTGVAQALMKAYGAGAPPQALKFSLWVNAENAGAVRLYQRFAYQSTKLEKRVYQWTGE